jgi:nucleoside-diphosphate-sugar epimerase
MELALSRKVPLLIFFSTMSVYGKIGVARVEEDLVPSDSYVDTDASLDDYGRSKLDAERTLKTMASNKTKVVVVRLPGVLGRGSSYNFISETFKKLKLNIPVSIRSPFACFNNVALDSDLGRFCRELTGQYINLKPFTVVNFAASGIFSVEEAILHLKSLIGSCSKVSYSDDYGASFTICIENLRRLGFEPLTVGEALNDFVRRYDEKIFQVG